MVKAMVGGWPRVPGILISKHARLQRMMGYTREKKERRKRPLSKRVFRRTDVVQQNSRLFFFIFFCFFSIYLDIVFLYVS